MTQPDPYASVDEWNAWRAAVVRRHSVVEMRLRHGRWEYRRPGRRGAWAKQDPDAAALSPRLRQHLAEIAEALLLATMARVRAGKADAKAARDAVIVETFEAFGLTPRPVPERSRAAMAASLHQCTARHVRAVIASWQPKKSGTG